MYSPLKIQMSKWVTTRMEEEEGSYLAGDDEEDA